MRALFTKEYRQSHLLVWMGLLLSALIAALYAVWSRKYVRAPVDQRDLDALCGYLLVVITGVMTLAASAGLFSSETGRGTLVYLLALPLSRSRIWLAKALAGLALVASGALLLIVPDALVIPGTVRELHLGLYLPDIVIWVLLGFSVTLFCSTLLQRTISVLLASAALLFALFLYVAWMVGILGVQITGYDDALDVALVVLAIVPPVLLASLLAFARGELLQSNRKWAFALPTLVGGIAVVSLVLLGAVRYTYRYQRARVERIEGVELAPRGAAVTFTSLGSPAPLERTSDHRWRRSTGASYRSRHLVVLDLKTGREAMVLPTTKMTALSPDGRYLAVLGGRFDGHSARSLRVWDLRGRRRVLRGAPRKLQQPSIGPLEWVSWSPEGEWLVLQTSSLDPRHGGGHESIVVMRPDGSQLAEIVLWEYPEPGIAPEEAVGIEDTRITSWGWAPGDSALYTLTLGGRLVRHKLADGKAETVWEPRAPSGTYQEGQQLWFSRLQVSPRGEFVALSVSLLASGESREAHRLVLLVPADGSRPFTIAQGTGAGLTAWSPDGRCLYLIGTRPFQIMRWRVGEAEATRVAAPANLEVRDRSVLPGGELLVWTAAAAYMVDGQGRFGPLPSPEIRSLPQHYRLVGIDSEGRALLSGRAGPPLLQAADLTTGRITKVYP